MSNLNFSRNAFVGQDGKFHDQRCYFSIRAPCVTLLLGVVMHFTTNAAVAELEYLLYKSCNTKRDCFKSKDFFHILANNQQVSI